MTESMNETELCYCVDSNTIDCGYVSAYSLYSRIAPDRYPALMVCHERGTDSPVSCWRDRFERKGISIPEIRGVEIDTTEIRRCKSLFDSYATYFRLFAPDFTTKKKLIYSDTDILYFSDIEGLIESELDDNVIGLDSGPLCGERDSIEREVLQKYGKGPLAMYYGAGLAVIDVNLYKTMNISEKCMQIIREDAKSLKSHDQTVWNCAIEEIKEIDHIDVWSAFKKDPENRGKKFGIAHFVGSPKPWDLAGEIIHDHHLLWKKEAQSAGLLLPDIQKYLKKQMWKRAWRIRKQYK